MTRAALVMRYTTHMDKTTLYLPTELHQALREVSQRTGQPQSAVVREALEGYLRQHRRPALRSVGLGDNEALHAAETEAWLEANLRSE